jgi:hypothetical protein
VGPNDVWSIWKTDLRVRLVPPSRKHGGPEPGALVSGAQRYKRGVPRLAAGGTNQPEPSCCVPSLLRPVKGGACPPGRLPLCFPDTCWLRPVVGQPRDGGGRPRGGEGKNTPCRVPAVHARDMCSATGAASLRDGEMPVSCRTFRASAGGWKNERFTSSAR